MLSRRLAHALESKVTASLDIKKPRVFAIEIHAKMALVLIKFSLNSFEIPWRFSCHDCIVPFKI